MSENKCPICKNRVYQINNLCLDSEGIREAIYCNHCHIIFRSSRGGFSKYAVMHKPTVKSIKEDIKSYCQNIIKELDKC